MARIEPVEPTGNHLHLLQLAFDHYKTTGEWPLVDQLQHAVDRAGEDLDVVDSGGSLDPALGRVDVGYQGRVMLTLRGVRRCVGSAAELEGALDTMRLALHRWMQDGPGATVSSADVESELGLEPALSRRILEYINWLPGIAGGTGMPDGSWTRHISRDVRRIRDVSSIDALVELTPLPRVFQQSLPNPPMPRATAITPAATRAAPRRSRRRRLWGGRWAWEGDLGEGGQAHTFHVRDLNDGSDGWVLKRLKNVRRIGRFEREVRALTRLKSEHIPPIIDHSLEDPPYLVTPYIGPDLEHLRDEQADLEQHLHRFRQVVVASADAHRAGVVHRDIKPNNVVVAPEGQTYLVDFGICADASEDLVLTTTAEGFGNRAFSAPECEPGALASATPASDVYSLGKLLFWMTTGGRLIVREAFDRDLLRVEEEAREVIMPLLVNTVREYPSQRWTSDELLLHLDWALSRLAEYRELASQGLIVLSDGFGPAHEVYDGGSHSATTPPHGNPPGQYEVAEAFSTRHERAELHSIELFLAIRAGAGSARVTLEMDDGGHPSGNPLAAWDVHLTGALAGGGEVVRVEPERPVELDADRTYWVCLAAVGDGSDIAWVSAALNLMPRKARFAERKAGAEWRPAESEGGPGHALRVLATSASGAGQTQPAGVPRTSPNNGSGAIRVMAATSSSSIDTLPAQRTS